MDQYVTDVTKLSQNCGAGDLNESLTWENALSCVYVKTACVREVYRECTFTGDPLI